ncbi:hypothetical protein C5Q97_06295 [Victivallales bacterium CCUG 44730]|nr:hypothetical protein C5Q97_06295 [Victivallales bacterium CCUG 44730]
MKFPKIQDMPHGIRLFVGGVAVSFGGMVLLGVVNYLIRRTLSQELPKPDFGFFYSMFALANLLTMLFQFGVKQAKTILIANFMARGQKKRINPLASSILFFTMTGSTMLCLGLLLAKSWLLEHFFKYPGGGTAYTIFLLYIFALPIWGILLSIPHGMKNFPLYYGLSILQMGAILCGCLCCAPRWGLNGVSAVWAASMLGTLLFAAWKIYSVYRIRISPRLALSRRICRKIWELCSWMSLSLAGIMLIGNLDTVCLTYLSTLDSVANYNIALPIVQIIQSLLVLPFVFMPIASSMWQQKRYAEIRKIFRAANLLMLAAVLPTWFLSELLGGWVIGFLFDSAFLAAKPALVILATGSLFLGIGQFNLNLLNSSGSQKIGAAIVLCAIALNLALNAGLIPKFGIVGAAFATAGSYLLIAVASFTVCRVLLRRKERNSRLEQ